MSIFFEKDGFTERYLYPLSFWLFVAMGWIQIITWILGVK